ncbi:PQQ-dependent sugar dehydrogenase [Guyparkeria sp. GHLCS8-2]|uniref:PQQ-dependent sugar dehydrogenase n=1 Tax=Guyparkeria halopsychrophila TaxID=3139421 RepID=UPI0037C5B67C
MSRARLALLALLSWFPLLAAHPAPTEPAVETIADDLHHPWALAFLPDGELLVTERRGRLWRVDPASGDRQAIDGLPEVDHRNQGGLLDVLAHPAHAGNRWIYLTWAGRCDGGNATHLGRGRLEGNRLVDFQTLHVATPCVDSGIHFGSRLAFDRDGYLFMTVGDRGERDRAQDLADHNGSVLRFHADGRIPEDNPFVGRPDAEAAIFSYGHRNPQGAATHPHTGRVWIHEHGPRGGDEINIPVAGANFGWPIQTYGREYAGPEIAPDAVEGVTGPLHHWTPSIAPSGMTFYGHPAAPDWQGSLFVGALAKRHLARLQLDGERVVNEDRWLEAREWRIRDVEAGPDGALWVITDHADGRLLRLTPD